MSLRILQTFVWTTKDKNKKRKVLVCDHKSGHNDAVWFIAGSHGIPYPTVWLWCGIQSCEMSGRLRDTHKSTQNTQKDGKKRKIMTVGETFGLITENDIRELDRIVTPRYLMCRLLCDGHSGIVCPSSCLCFFSFICLLAFSCFCDNLIFSFWSLTSLLST